MDAGGAATLGAPVTADLMLPVVAPSVARGVVTLPPVTGGGAAPICGLVPALPTGP